MRRGGERKRCGRNGGSLSSRFVFARSPNAGDERFEGACKSKRLMPMVPIIIFSDYGNISRGLCCIRCQRELWFQQSAALVAIGWGSCSWAQSDEPCHWVIREYP